MSPSFLPKCPLNVRFQNPETIVYPIQSKTLFGTFITNNSSPAPRLKRDFCFFCALQGYFMYLLISFDISLHELFLALARQSEPKCYIQTAWIRVRRRATRRLTKIQAVWQSEKIFTNFERHWITLKKLKQTRNLSRRQFISRAKG